MMPASPDRARLCGAGAGFTGSGSSWLEGTTTEAVGLASAAGAVPAVGVLFGALALTTGAGWPGAPLFDGAGGSEGFCAGS